MSSAHGTVVISMQLVERLFATLRYYANICTYEGERIGGVVAGCPRSPEPTAEQLVVEAERAADLLTDAVQGKACVAPGQEFVILKTLRDHGWKVAVHNDYRLSGKDHTFWLFTKNGRAIKGEGESDLDALVECRKAVIAAG